MPTPPEWSQPELADLAREYLRLVEATQGGVGDPRYRPHAASERSVLHDQILSTLKLTRDDPFDVVAWAKRTAARQGVATQSPLFETNQPLERYRLHHALRLTDFAAFLGISQDDYFALIAGDTEQAAALRGQIAGYLRTSPWLINELAPMPDEEELGEVLAAIEESEEHGYWRVDPVTGEMEGSVFLDLEPEPPPAPSEHLQLAEALATLLAVHPSENDLDYPALRGYLEGRIRGVLQLGRGEVLNAEAWADDVLGGQISRIRQRSAASADGPEAAR